MQKAFIKKTANGSGKYDVVACFDDDPEICEMYKNEGLLVFEVKR